MWSVGVVLSESELVSVGVDGIERQAASSRSIAHGGSMEMHDTSHDIYDISHARCMHSYILPGLSA